MPADPHVFEITQVYDLDGIPLRIGVDHDAVTIDGRRLDLVRTETFAQAFVRATWLAAQYQDEQASDA